MALTHHGKKSTKYRKVDPEINPQVRRELEHVVTDWDFASENLWQLFQTLDNMENDEDVSKVRPHKLIKRVSNPVEYQPGDALNIISELSDAGILKDKRKDISVDEPENIDYTEYESCLKSIRLERHIDKDEVDKYDVAHALETKADNGFGFFHPLPYVTNMLSESKFDEEESLREHGSRAVREMEDDDKLDFTGDQITDITDIFYDLEILDEDEIIYLEDSEAKMIEEGYQIFLKNEYC